MPKRAKIFIAVTAASGAAVFGTALLSWHSNDWLRFGCYFLIALAAATMKVPLPGIDGTMSVHFLFVLLGVLELSLPETLIIVCAAVLLQTLWKTKRPLQPVKILFNIFSMTCNAVYLTYLACHLAARYLNNSLQLLLGVAACVYFLGNTLPIAIVIALAEQRSLRKIWRETYFWSFPYYLVGAALVGFFSYSNRRVGWESTLLILPVMYWIYRSYYLYLGRLEDAKKRVEIEKLQVEAEKCHVEQVSALHLRTIEALAAAIDAKDHTTHDHLHRVRTYAIEIAKELGLDERELDALRAAALLHDIGKLAVPDHIISKPGRLTPEEFDKMKIHPLVGAELLEKVAFPYPVAPIVRSHHEKWNGTGYPDGLKAEEIPIGARILAAVDCLDALASHRQYRRALPLDEAMRKVADDSGISFDPKVVEVLQRRYIELERMALSTMASVPAEPRASAKHTVERGERPAAGFELNTNRRGSDSDVLASIASARQEAHTLFELTQDLGNSLSLDETLSLVSVRLRRLIPYDSIVAFVRDGDVLKSEFVSGDNFRLLSSLRIPVGEGLCGWVAQNWKPIINGNPAVEHGYVADPKRGAELRSALAVPLVGVGNLVGVLALYRTEADTFTSDHLRILQVITSKVALSIENALKYRQAESSATTDYLTGLPNARSLFMHLDQELARCAREHSGVAVMVCDLNGFKHVNDLCGHLEGDKTLKLFANLLKDVCREYDYVARMGGDEFVIIAPNMTSETVRERAILLNALAQQAGREVSGKDLISLSLGAAFCPQDGSDAECLLAEADRRMYVAKGLHYEHTELGLPRGAPLDRAASVH
ncbi:MAG: HD domain-containing phosphohydrolase [Terriglobales bacterium]|jgi:diguanylate cyclase (GGDEF)-like protein/putative nucleotidyltransferase with HDIG domain